MKSKENKLKDFFAERWNIEVVDKDIRVILLNVKKKKFSEIGFVLGLISVFLLFFFSPNSVFVLFWCILLSSSILLIAIGQTTLEDEADKYIEELFVSGNRDMIPVSLRKKITKKYDRELDVSELMHIYINFKGLGKSKSGGALGYLFYLWAILFELIIVGIFFLPTSYIDVIVIIFSVSCFIFIPTIFVLFKVWRQKDEYIKSCLSHKINDNANQ